jgi:uncharacterized membrane protein
MHELLLFLAVLLACAVESVEALTIVLAMGVTRDWRSALLGTGAALVVLAALVAAIGPSLDQLPLDSLRLVVGAALLVFGLGWLRKSILRASGLKALHDEDEIFAREAAAASSVAARSRWHVRDWYAFTLSFKGVLLEGLEVVFIVLTVGANQAALGIAAAAAVAAVVLVTGAGVVLHRPLARVPENAMKFGVGVMLTAFGCFWSAEGAGADWPGGDAALVVLVVAVAAAAWLLVLAARRVAMLEQPA